MIAPDLFLRNVLEGLVTIPEDLSIERTTDEMGVLLTVKVNKADMGKIIGKEGATAKAIRHLVNACGLSQQEKVSVKILEPNR